MNKFGVHEVLRNLKYLILAISVFSQPFCAQAAMSSSNYTIWADSVDSGGNNSSSASYIGSDSIGENASAGAESSSSYALYAGLPAIFDEPLMEFSASAATPAFSPNINPSIVSTASYTLTISTNAPFGYAVEALEDGAFRNGGTPIPNVSDGTVTAGSAEYGIRVSGTDAAFGDDEGLSASVPLTVASRSNWVTGSTIDVTHRASVTTGFATGAYSHIITYVAVGNF